MVGFNPYFFPKFQTVFYSLLTINFLFMFSFVKNRYTFYAIALTLLILSLLSPLILGLNEGIDMTGGMQIEYSVEKGDITAIIEKTKSALLEASRTSLTDGEK
jgi:preprotein translocase subunit SecF